MKFVGYIIISLGISIFILLVIFFFNHNNLIPVEFNGHLISLSELNTLVFEQPNDTMWAYVGISLALISFMFFLLIAGSSLVFSLKSKLIKYTSWTTFSIGLMGIVICIGVGIKTASSFNEEVEIERTAHTFSGDTLLINTQSLGIYSVKNDKMDIDENQSLTVSGNTISIHGIEFTYQQSPDTLFRVIHHFSARGNSTKTAIQRIKNMCYSSSIKNNQLILPTYFSFPKGDHLRDQSVEIEIEIPKGKSIKVNGNTIVFELTKFEDRTILGGGSLDPAGNYFGW